MDWFLYDKNLLHERVNVGVSGTLWVDEDARKKFLFTTYGQGYLGSPWFWGKRIQSTSIF